MKGKNELVEQQGNVAVKPKKKKKVWIAILVVVVLLVAIIGKVLSSATQEVAMLTNLVEIEPVQMRDLSDTISLKGTISGESKTNIVSKAATEVTGMNVQVGDIVQEGDILCTLDSTSIEQKIADLEKSISNANAVESINSQQAADAVEDAKQAQTTRLEEAQIVIDRAEGVMGGIQYRQEHGEEVPFAEIQAAQQTLDDAQRNYEQVLESTNDAIEDAQTQMELNQYKDSDSSTQDTLDDLREQLNDCVVVAPCSGVVTAVNASVGDINTAKSTIITIEDTSALKLVATVDESDILKLEEGMNAVVTADATGEQEIAGTVTRVVRVKNQSTGTDNAAGGYSVEISIDNQDLLIGMAAKAKVMIKEKGEVLAIPYDLIRYDENGEAYVLVAEVSKDGSAVAVRRNIEIGEEVDYYTEVTGGDLKEGDMLIYDYTYSIMEGDTFAPEQMYSNQDLGIDMEGMESDGSVVEVVE